MEHDSGRNAPLQPLGEKLSIGEKIDRLERFTTAFDEDWIAALTIRMDWYMDRGIFPVPSVDETSENLIGRDA